MSESGSPKYDKEPSINHAYIIYSTIQYNFITGDDHHECYLCIGSS